MIGKRGSRVDGEEVEIGDLTIVPDGNENSKLHVFCFCHDETLVIES